MQTVYVLGFSTMSLNDDNKRLLKIDEEKERKESQRKESVRSRYFIYMRTEHGWMELTMGQPSVAAFLQIPSRVKNRRRTLLSHPNRPPPVFFSPLKKKKGKKKKKEKKLFLKNTFQVKRHLIPTRQTNKAMLSFNYSGETLGKQFKSRTGERG